MKEKSDAEKSLKHLEENYEQMKGSKSDLQTEN